MRAWLKARLCLPCWVLLSCLILLFWTCVPGWLANPMVSGSGQMAPFTQQSGLDTNREAASGAAEVPQTAQAANPVDRESTTMELADRSFSVMAFGDILLARTPGARVEDNGFRYPFTGIRDMVLSADIAFANLETPASWLGTPYPGKPEDVTFRADPTALFGLAWAGFDLVSLANNHINDYGPRALEETLDFLDLLGVARVGAGRNLEEARRAVVIERDGVRFAFLAYAESIWSVVAARPAAASRTRSRLEERFHGPLPPLVPPARPDAAASSLAGVAIADIQAMAGDVKQVLSRVNPDYLFVSVHWGDEHQRIPNRFQRAFGRAAIDAGATAVLGHHPHVLQAVEKYNGGLIIYSLGNLVFDMAADATYETAAFDLKLKSGRLESVKLVPIRIARGTYIPVPAAEADAKKILEGLRVWSGVTGKAIRIEGGVGLLNLD